MIDFDAPDHAALIAEAAQIQQDMDVLRSQLLQLRGDLTMLQLQVHTIVVRFRALHARQQAIAQALADTPPTPHTR